MKAAVLYGPRDLRIEERPIPAIRDAEILLKVRSAALCGTDLRMWTNGVPGDPPLVLGHEVAGVIERVGASVEGYAAGDRVSVAPNTGCGLCDSCVSGNTHMCAAYKALGISLDGAFEEYMVIPEAAVRQGNVSKIGPDIHLDSAAAVEALSCVYNGFEHYQVHPGDNVLVIGAGPIGAMHALLALMAGATRVIVSDLSPDRLKLLHTIIPSIHPYAGSGLKDEVMALTGGAGLNVCVVACPSPAAQASSFELMAVGGRVCFFGGLPKGKDFVSLNTNLIHYRQLMVTGTSRASLAQYRKCLRLVESGVVELDRLITHRYPIERIGAAFRGMEAAEGLKTVIRFED